jgi:hypothetical protein
VHRDRVDDQANYIGARRTGYMANRALITHHRIYNRKPGSGKKLNEKAKLREGDPRPNDDSARATGHTMSTSCCSVFS